MAETHREVVEAHIKFGGRYHGSEQVCGPHSTQLERTAAAGEALPIASDTGLTGAVNIALQRPAYSLDPSPYQPAHFPAPHHPSPPAVQNSIRTNPAPSVITLSRRLSDGTVLLARF